MFRRILYLAIALLTVTSLSRAQEKNKVRSLEPGETIEQSINVGEVHKYRITLDKRKFLKLTVRERISLDILVRLAGLTIKS